MQRTCYHVFSDHHNEFLNTMREVKTSICDWQNHGDAHIKVYKIDSEDIDSDEISINEYLLSFDEININ